MIVVAGGTGRLGKALVDRLVGAGRPVRVFARGLSAPPAGVVELIRGDIRSADDVARAVEGADVVVSAVQGFAGPGRVSPRSVDREGNRMLIRESARVGADVVLVSLTHAAPDSPLEMAREKYAAEQALRESGAAWTIVRAAAFTELWIQLLRDTAGRNGRPLVFGRADRPLWWVSVSDVADVVSRTTLDESARGHTIDVVGPEGLTLEELARKVMAAHGWAGSPRRVPPAALRIGSVTAGVLVPSIRRQMLAALAMDRLLPETDHARHDGSGRRTVDQILAAEPVRERR